MHFAADNGDLCFDPMRLVGTTTVVAKPGTKQELLDAFKTMPIPIRKEEGCVFYDVLNNTNPRVRRSLLGFMFRV